MTFRSHLRMFAAAALAAALSVTLVAPAEARPRQLDRIDLPVGFQPEGIAIGKGPYAYLGSLADGDIYRANLRTGKGRVISQGPGTPSVGLKLDRRGRPVRGRRAERHRAHRQSQDRPACPATP